MVAEVVVSGDVGVVLAGEGCGLAPLFLRVGLTRASDAARRLDRTPPHLASAPMPQAPNVAATDTSYEAIGSIHLAAG